jgi:hypothetical protein
MVMKRSKFIKKALNHTSNTVCVNEEQVEVMLNIFEKLGVLPPETKATPEDFTHIDFTQEFLDNHDFTVNRWEEE